MKTRILLAAVVAVLCSFQVHADENRVRATIIGENYCLHCSLVMADDPEAQCGPDTCSYALKVTEAKDKEGIAIEGLEGVTLHYITSDAGNKLKTDKTLYGQDVELEGMVFLAEHAIHVEDAKLYDEFNFDDLDISNDGNKASADR